MAKDDIDLDNIDFNKPDELDFDNLNMATGDVPDDRNPTTAIAKTFWNGAVTSASDTRNIEDHIRKAVPHEFTVVADDVKKHYDVLDKAKRNLLTPIQKELPNFKRDLNKLSPLVTRMVGERFGNKFDELTKVKDRSSENIDPDQQEIANSTASIFGTWRDSQLEDRKADMADKLLSGATEEQRFKSNYELLTKISNNAASQTQYQEQVTLKLSEKKLELSFKKYHLLRNILRVATEASNASITELKAITKNTGLPDIIKRHNSENFKQLFLDNWQGRTAETAVDAGRDFMKSWGSNVIKKAQDAAQSAVESMQTIADGASTMGDMDAMQGEMGGPRKSGKQTAIDTALGAGGGLLTGKIFGFLGKKLKEQLDNDPSMAGKVAYAKYAQANQGQLLTSAIEGLANKDGIFGVIGRAIQSTMPSLSKDRESAIHSLADNATQESIWDRISRETLVKIIPGWLSKIHYRLSQLVNGKDNATPEVFDVNAERFVTKEEHLNILKDKLQSTEDKDGVKAGVDSFIKNLYARQTDHTQEELSPEQSDALRKIVLEHASNNAGFDVKALGNIETYKNELPNLEDADKLRSIVGDLLSIGESDNNKLTIGQFSDGGGEANKLADLTRDLQRIRAYTDNFQAGFNQLHQYGSNQDLVDLGLAENTKSHKTKVIPGALRDLQLGKHQPLAEPTSLPPKPLGGVGLIRLDTKTKRNDDNIVSALKAIELQLVKVTEQFKPASDTSDSIGGILFDCRAALKTLSEGYPEDKENLKATYDTILTGIADLNTNILNVDTSLGVISDDLYSSLDVVKSTNVSIDTGFAMVAERLDAIISNRTTAPVSDEATSDDVVIQTPTSGISSRLDTIIHALNVGNQNTAPTNNDTHNTIIDLSSITQLADAVYTRFKTSSTTTGGEVVPYNDAVREGIAKANLSLTDILGVLGETYAAAQANHAEVMGRNSFREFIGRTGNGLLNLFKAPFKAITGTLSVAKNFVTKQKDRVVNLGRKVVGGVTGFGKGIYNEVRNQLVEPDDVYVVGGTTPVLYGREIKKGKYYNQNAEGKIERKPIRSIREIKGVVVSLPDNRVVVTADDYAAGLETRNPTFLAKVGGFAVKAIVAPFKVIGFIKDKTIAALGWTKNKIVSGTTSLTNWMNRAATIYDAQRQVLLARIDIERGKYYVIKDGRKHVLRSISDIGMGPVYRYEDNEIVLSTEQIQEGIFNVKGKLIKIKTLSGLAFSGVAGAANLAWKIVKAPIDIISKGLSSLRQMFENKLIKSLLINVPDNVIFQANTVNLFAGKVLRGKGKGSVDIESLLNTNKKDKKKLDHAKTDTVDKDDSPEDLPPKNTATGLHVPTVEGSKATLAAGIATLAAKVSGKPRKPSDIQGPPLPELVGPHVPTRTQRISADTSSFIEKTKNRFKPTEKQLPEVELVGPKKPTILQRAKSDVNTLSERAKGKFKEITEVNQDDLLPRRSSHRSKKRSEDARENALGSWNRQIALASGKESKKSTKKDATNIITIMKSIVDLERVKNKVKRVRGDSDGDGLRDGGWRSQLKARKDRLLHRNNTGSVDDKKNHASDGRSGILSSILNAITGFGSVLGLAAAAAGAIALASGAAGSMGELMKHGVSLSDAAMGIGGAYLGYKTGAIKAVAKGGWWATSKLASLAGENLIKKPAMEVAAKFAAKRMAGSSLLLAGGSVLGPIGIAVAGIALTVWTVFDIGRMVWGWLDRRSPIKALEYLRFMEYGFYVGESGDFEERKIALRYFEKEMFNKMAKTDKGIVGIKANFDDIWKDYSGDFNLDIGDNGSKAAFKEWYDYRFKPVFFKWLTACSAITRRTGTQHTFSNLQETLDPSQYRYFTTTVTTFADLNYDPLDLDASPFPDIPIAQAKRKEVMKFVDKYLAKQPTVTLGEPDGATTKIDKSSVVGSTNVLPSVAQVGTKKLQGLTKHKVNNRVAYGGILANTGAMETVAQTIAHNKQLDSEAGLVDPRIMGMSLIVRGELNEKMYRLVDVVRSKLHLTEKEMLNLVVSYLDKNFDIGIIKKVISGIRIWVRKALVPMVTWLVTNSIFDEANNFIPYTQQEGHLIVKGLKQALDDSDANDVEFDLTLNRFREIGMFGGVDKSVFKPQDYYSKLPVIPKEAALVQPPVKGAVQPPVIATQPVSRQSAPRPVTTTFTPRVPTYGRIKPSAPQDIGLATNKWITDDTDTQAMWARMIRSILMVNPKTLRYSDVVTAFIGASNNPEQAKANMSYNDSYLTTICGRIIYPMLEYLDKRLGRLGNGYKSTTTAIFKAVMGELKTKVPFTEYRFSLVNGIITMIGKDTPTMYELPVYHYESTGTDELGEPAVVLPLPKTPVKTPVVNAKPREKNKPTVAPVGITVPVDTATMDITPVVVPPRTSVSSVVSPIKQQSITDYVPNIAALFVNVKTKEFYDFLSSTILLRPDQRTITAYVQLFRGSFTYFKNNVEALKLVRRDINVLMGTYLNPIYSLLDTMVGRGTYGYQPLPTKEFSNVVDKLKRDFGDLCVNVVYDEELHVFNFNGKRPIALSEKLNSVMNTNPTTGISVDTSNRSDVTKAAATTDSRPVEVDEQFISLGEYTPSKNADLDYDPDNAYAKAIAQTVGNFNADTVTLVKLVRTLFGISKQHRDVEATLKQFIQTFAASGGDTTWYKPWEETLMVWLRENLLPSIDYVIQRVGRVLAGHALLNRISSGDFDIMKKELSTLFGSSTKYHVTYLRRVMTYTNASATDVSKPAIQPTDIVINKPLNYDFLLEKPLEAADPISAAQHDRWDNVVKPSGTWGGVKPTINKGTLLAGISIGSGHTGITKAEMATKASAGHVLSDDIERRIAQYDSMIDTNSAKTGVDARLIRSVIRQESHGKADAQSHVGARGLMQIMPETGRVDLGIDPSMLTDPATSIRGGSEYLRRQLKRFKGSVELALAAYNAGGGNVNRAIRIAGTRDPEAVLNALPQVTGRSNSRQTQDYVVKITNDYRRRMGIPGKSVADKEANRVVLYSALDPSRVNNVKMTQTSTGGMGDSVIAPLTVEGTKRFGFQTQNSIGTRGSYSYGKKVNPLDAVVTKPAANDDVADEPQAIKDALAWDTTKDTESPIPKWEGKLKDGGLDRTVRKVDKTVAGVSGSLLDRVLLGNDSDSKTNTVKPSGMGVTNTPAVEFAGIKKDSENLRTLRLTDDARQSQAEAASDEGLAIGRKQLQALTKISNNIELLVKGSNAKLDKEPATSAPDTVKHVSTKAEPPTKTVPITPKRFQRKVLTGEPTINLDRKIS